MRKSIIIISFFLYLSGCTINEVCQKEGGSNNCTWWSDDGKSHECRCSVIGEGDSKHTVCSGDCR